MKNREHRLWCSVLELPKGNNENLGRRLISFAGLCKEVVEQESAFLVIVKIFIK